MQPRIQDLVTQATGVRRQAACCCWWKWISWFNRTSWFNRISQFNRISWFNGLGRLLNRIIQWECGHDQHFFLIFVVLWAEWRVRLKHVQGQVGLGGASSLAHLAGNCRGRLVGIHLVERGLEERKKKPLQKGSNYRTTDCRISPNIGCLLVRYSDAQAVWIWIMNIWITETSEQQKHLNNRNIWIKHRSLFTKWITNFNLFAIQLLGNSQLFRSWLENKAKTL